MKKIFFVCTLLILSLTLTVNAGSLNDTASYLTNAVPEAYPGSVGGEWLVSALKMYSSDTEDGYYQKYLDNLKSLLLENNGILSERKYTEYSRTVIALRTLSQNPADFCGFDLTEPLKDYDKVIFQGTNGAVYALIALEGISDDTDLLKKYAEFILSRQNTDGGFSLSAGGISETDITAMALCALKNMDYPYEKRLALKYLSEVQKDNGCFESDGVTCSESTAQVLCALSSLNISVHDKRFVKGGNTVKDALLLFENPDGSFCHTLGGKADIMATEQALYALSVKPRAAINIKPEKIKYYKTFLDFLNEDKIK